MTLCSAVPEVLVSKREVLLPGDTTSPLKWSLRLPAGLFGNLMPLNQQTKRGVTVLAGLIDPDYHRQTKLPLHNVGKDEYVWNIRDPLGLF